VINVNVFVCVATCKELKLEKFAQQKYHRSRPLRCCVVVTAWQLAVHRPCSPHQFINYIRARRNDWRVNAACITGLDSVAVASDMEIRHNYTCTDRRRYCTVYGRTVISFTVGPITNHSTHKRRG